MLQGGQGFGSTQHHGGRSLFQLTECKQLPCRDCAPVERRLWQCAAIWPVLEQAYGCSALRLAVSKAQEPGGGHRCSLLIRQEPFQPACKLQGLFGAPFGASEMAECPTSAPSSELNWLLQLYGNNFTGCLPGTWPGSLPTLGTLLVQDNKLSGALPQSYDTWKSLNTM